MHQHSYTAHSTVWPSYVPRTLAQEQDVHWRVYIQRADQNKMIRCCVWVIWLHQECVDVSDDTESGIWTCLEGRLINGRVKDFANSLRNLTSLTEAIYRKSDIADQSRKEEPEQVTAANEGKSDTREKRSGPDCANLGASVAVSSKRRR